LTILQKSRKIDLYRGGSDMSDLGNKEIFSKNLKYYMELNNKTRIDVCRDLDLPYTTFAEWYNGNIYPRIDKIELLARYFGIEKSDLIENKEQQNNNINEDKRLVAFYEGYNDLDEADKDVLMATFDAFIKARKGDK
jgi:transcriptional regulator with XRE-family HTH domain